MFQETPSSLIKSCFFQFSKPVKCTMFIPTSVAKAEKTFSLYKWVWIVCRCTKHTDFASPDCKLLPVLCVKTVKSFTN